MRELYGSSRRLFLRSEVINIDGNGLRTDLLDEGAGMSQVDYWEPGGVPIGRDGSITTIHIKSYRCFLKTTRILLS